MITSRGLLLWKPCGGLSKSKSVISMMLLYLPTVLFTMSTFLESLKKLVASANALSTSSQWTWCPVVLPRKSMPSTWGASWISPTKLTQSNVLMTECLSGTRPIMSMMSSKLLTSMSTRTITNEASCLLLSLYVLNWLNLQIYSCLSSLIL